MHKRDPRLLAKVGDLGFRRYSQKSRALAGVRAACAFAHSHKRQFPIACDSVLPIPSLSAIGKMSLSPQISESISRFDIIG
ncbi:hypothetical protein DP116_15590 [Brasilonema bromeliae SPC951]|uniref:Uncharacterized protein n=1 Tax=Brasilonema bromeliae SPC951 TaxID=385972 RepID=A0ABX1PB25_9CYAN|nr:hypothetical protein [Brasilonema bromeliae SPC951]